MNTPQTHPSRPLTDLLYAKATRMLVPLSGSFELSPVCNFNCRMCYVRKTQKEVQESPRKILTLDDWRRIAREARDAGMLYLLLTGGEPLLWPDFWTLYDELVDMGFLVSVNTNGSLIDAKAIEHFRQKPPQQLNITLYGAGDATYQRLCGVGGVFSKIDTTIQDLQKAGVVVKLNCSLTPDNADDLDQIVEYSKKQDTILSVATYMFPPVRRDLSMVGENRRFTPEDAAAYHMRYLHRQRGDDVYRYYLEQIAAGYTEPLGLDTSCIDPADGQIRCRAGKAAFWITWDGWMLPCGMMPEPKIDLVGKSFEEAWRQITQAAAAVRLSGVCDKCAVKEICHPCAAMAFAETGSCSGIPTYLCRMTRQTQAIAMKTLFPDEKT